ncbi:lamin tail domain-containing protein 2 isoform X9 [Kogia breviceps]|uniref:lamin tail domain-containing protein 2 isoform X9 n=1 Tax=Kogia breviceps TaxID=27615 RepID=UPI0034D17D73
MAPESCQEAEDAEEEAFPSLVDRELVSGHVGPPASTSADSGAPACPQDTKPSSTRMVSSVNPQSSCSRKLLQNQVQKLTLELEEQKEQAQLEKAHLEEWLLQTGDTLRQLEAELQALQKSCLLQLARSSWVGRMLQSSTGSVEVVTAETLMDPSDLSENDQSPTAGEGFRLEDVDWNSIAHRYPNLFTNLESSSDQKQAASPWISGKPTRTGRARMARSLSPVRTPTPGIPGAVQVAGGDGRSGWLRAAAAGARLPRVHVPLPAQHAAGAKAPRHGVGRGAPQHQAADTLLLGPGARPLPLQPGLRDPPPEPPRRGPQQAPGRALRDPRVQDLRRQHRLVHRPFPALRGPALRRPRGTAAPASTPAQGSGAGGPGRAPAAGVGTSGPSVRTSSPGPDSTKTPYALLGLSPHLPRARPCQDHPSAIQDSPPVLHLPWLRPLRNHPFPRTGSSLTTTLAALPRRTRVQLPRLSTRKLLRQREEPARPEGAAETLPELLPASRIPIPEAELRLEDCQARKEHKLPVSAGAGVRAAPGPAPPGPCPAASQAPPPQVRRKSVDRGCPMVALSVQSTAESRFGFRFLSCPPITADSRWQV